MTTDRRAAAPRQVNKGHLANPQPRRRLGDLDAAGFDQFMQRLLVDVERQRLDAVLTALPSQVRPRPALATA